MKDQLGIKTLRPGPSGNAAPGAPNAANYDPAKANPYPDLPDPLTLKNGRKVTTADVWWKQRRPEIVEDFEREVFGRVPAQRARRDVGGEADGEHTGRRRAGDREAARRSRGQLVVSGDHRGHPDDGRHAGQRQEASAGVDDVRQRARCRRRRRQPNRPSGPPSSAQQLIAAGWGYASISPASIQADNGAGLTRGIIGLVNKGQARKPDDWGSLRAWAWGASRGLDYLETDPAVDIRHVGIEGVSRYGKAALVAAAFEPRFAMVLVGSSGEGGAKLHRRNFGEAVENLTGAGEYHWMAGNFLKYGTAESTFGAKTAGDIPVDAHQLIALVAPRWVFISYGIPEKGDAHWLDQQGSYMAAVAAGPVFRLLGVKDLGEKQDYRIAKMPPVNVGLLDGELAWRQHDGGHEDRSNMKYFIEWANGLMQRSGRR